MDWRYIAGFFDADGSIGISRSKDKRAGNVSKIKGYTLTPTISLHNSHRGVLQSMSRFINEELNLDTKVYDRSRRECDWADQYVASIGGWEMVRKVSERILPFSVVKKEQLEIYLNNIMPIVSSRDRVSGGEQSKQRHPCLTSLHWEVKNFLEVIKYIDKMNSLKTHRNQKSRYSYEFLKKELVG